MRLFAAILVAKRALSTAFSQHGSHDRLRDRTNRLKIQPQGSVWSMCSLLEQEIDEEIDLRRIKKRR
jgi:hypothetical protein